ncbi:N-acetyltransferase, partial [Staphylococcus aureus]|nr:N-acetyltransferase [Staphylococcus aureus]
KETVINLFYKLHPSLEVQGNACEAITAIKNFENYIYQETVKVIMTNKCNQLSIILEERLKFKLDNAMDDIINQ